MIKLNKNHGRRSERGFALFVAIFTLLLITAITVSMLMLTNTDTSISANFRDEQTAFFAAKAGLEEVRDRMRVNATNSLNNGTSGVQVLPGAATPNSAPPTFGSANAVTYVTNPLNGENDTPWVTNGSAYPDDEICVEAAYLGTGNGCAGNPPRPRGTSNWYQTASASATYASSPVQAWKWVRIDAKTNQTSSGTSAVSTVDGDTTSYKLVCWDGNTQLTIAAGSCASAGAALVPAQNYMPVYVLTALAVTPSGSRRMVQMDVATDIIPNIPGAMVMDGDLPSFSPANSNAFRACGADGVSCAGSATHPPQNGTVCPPHGNEPAVGTYDIASNALVNTALASSGRSGNYTGSPSNVANVGTALGTGGMNTVQGLTALVNQVAAAASAANTYTNASGLTNPGTVTNPVINVVTGDLDVTNLTGAGILLVEGNASFGGRPNYDGVILIIGKGSIDLSGGGNGVLDGAMLVANLYDSSGTRIPYGAPGAPTINFSGGGNMTIQYDSCWVAAMNQSSPYKSLGIREIAF
ncbi:MAG: pilus assembly PilX family protein [Terriglobales bacterium]